MTSGPRRAAGVRAGLHAGLVAVGVGSLAAAGRRWETVGASGAVAAQPGWAAAVAAAWLAAAVAHVRVPATRATHALAAAAGCVTAGALLVATARLVDALRDGTTVASLGPTAAGWAAPAALAAVLVAGAARREVPGRWRAPVGAAGAVGAAAGVALGLLPVAVATGRLDRPAEHALVWGVRPTRVAADVMAPVGDALYVAQDRTLTVLDARGRAYPIARFDDLRPEGYVGHRSLAGADVIGPDDVVGLFGLGGPDVAPDAATDAVPDAAPDAGLVVATRRAVFTVGRDGPGRLLLVLAHDRTQLSLATATAAGAGVAATATQIYGAGPVAGGGMAVATDRGLLLRGPDGAVSPLPAADELLSTVDPGAGRVLVVGRPDGSVVLGVPCAVHQVAADGRSLTTLADWRGDGCVDGAPPAVTVDAAGVVVALRADRVAQGPDALDRPPVPGALVGFDGRGRLVAWYPDGRGLQRSPEAR